MLDPRLILEDCVNTRRWCHITTTDGEELTFLACGVTCRLDDNNVPIWLSVGLAWNPTSHEEQYAAVRIDFVAAIRYVDDPTGNQPPPVTPPP